ncbi:hypothetical protein M433DRAFT_136523 [Acidomyces richmondensis BFW]|nr:hypothetical protein M433DRAFT_136523 [Acidomyces richmondensis BFW]
MSKICLSPTAVAVKDQADCLTRAGRQNYPSNASKVWVIQSKHVSVLSSTPISASNDYGEVARSPSDHNSCLGTVAGCCEAYSHVHITAATDDHATKLAQNTQPKGFPPANEAEEETEQSGCSRTTSRLSRSEKALSEIFEKACSVDEIVALEDYSDSMSSSSQAPDSWIRAFCSLVGHEYFAEVSEDFIEDDFNLTGLQSQVPMYKEALEMILDVEPEDASDEEEEEEEDEDEDEDDMQHDGPEGVGRGYRRTQAAAERRHLRMASDLSMIESSAEMLYGLIHQRFITSRQGIQQMAEKYEFGHFGHCPRVFCHGAKVLPVGCSDIPGQETVKLFCPSCLDVYTPPNSRFQTVDGAFFGTTFGCLFFMTFPELDVGGQKPPQDQETSSSPNTTKDGRGSLSSSLASIQQPIPSAKLSQTPPQPDSINGVAPKNLAPGLGEGNIYEPRIYGFRVSEFAKTGPRMKWLRSRPADVNELDECRIWVESQEALGSGARLEAAPDFEDSEMADGAVDMHEGEIEDAEMNGNSPSGRVPNETREVRMNGEEVQQRQRRTSRRRTHEGMLNGQSGGTALSVGGAG